MKKIHRNQSYWSSKNCFSLRLKTRKLSMDFRLLGSSFHCLMAIKEKPFGDRERSRERWKLWLLPRVLWVWTTERDLKFGSRYLGAKLCRIRKRWDILKNRTRSGMFNHDKFRRFLLSTCPRKSILWINRTIFRWTTFNLSFKIAERPPYQKLQQ